MADAHSTDELAERLGVEEVANHAVALALVEAALGPAGDDAASILAAEVNRGSGGRGVSSAALGEWRRSARWTGLVGKERERDAPAVLEELEAFSKLGRDVVLRREEDCEDAACVVGWTDGRDRVS